MFSFRTVGSRWLLWLLALAALCFLASLFPEVRQRVWGTPPTTAEKG